MTVAFSPGRVNLIGDHTDYAGGLVCPMAIDLGTTVEVERTGRTVRLRSSAMVDDAVVELDCADPGAVEPAWARYVAGVVAELRPTPGAIGRVTTTLPVGAGLSSSAALELAVALALGAPMDDPVALAQLAQRAEQRASGVPCGIMDQLICATGIAGHALVIDCATLEGTPVSIPPEVEVVIVDSGETRALAGSAYAERRAAVEAAEIALRARLRDDPDVSALADPVLMRRARHVVTENRRVRAFAAAVTAAEFGAAGAVMAASHASLRDDFEVSTPAIDALVDRLSETPGVWGARITGAGFGGCVVALTQAGIIDRLGIPGARVVRAGPAAHLIRS